MRQVLLALTPLMLASIYFYGWKALAVLVLVNAAGFLSEYIFSRVYNTKVTEAVFVTNVLFALSLPPTIPLWIPVIGIVFGVVFGKMAFGGFGRNVFNPALTGRAFIYVSFGAQMTASSAWVLPPAGAAGALGRWQADAVSSATPLVNLADGGSESLLKLFLGNIPGSFGETSALLILIGGIYLMVRKTASWRIIVAGTAAYLVTQLIFWLAKAGGAYDPLSGLLSGSLLYGMIFMATDPISSSQTTDLGRVLYGVLIGVLTALIRTFSVWPEGITFSILLANMFAPLLNYLIQEGKARKKTRMATAAAGNDGPDAGGTGKP
ncbi:MAG: RnfABCDGE type electron transport complex subunit D [Spirochaetales bacterium]|nr:RnfABCDGE type electron transport complex subunit D [Spirochaetales bacterium]